MFLDWPEHTAHVKKSFGSLGKTHPKMLQAYLALNDAAAAEALDIKTRELISIAVAITTRCESWANSNMRCDSFKSLMIINKLSKFL